MGKGRIRVSREAFPKLFTNGTFRIEHGIPNDSKLVCWNYDETFDQFNFVFESLMSPEAQEVTFVPEIIPIYKRLHGEVDEVP